MIPIKTKQQIQIMQAGGQKLKMILQKTLAKAKPGTTTKELDLFAEELIRKEGGKPSFQMVPGYQWATCMCVNDCVVHGVPDDRFLKEGDILGIDMGMYYKGMHTDMAKTLRVLGNSKFPPERRAGEIRNSKKIDKFLKTGERALEKAIEQVKPGNRIGHISRAVQETVERAGYSTVEELVGHGVGKKLHENPEVPCFVKGKISKTPLLEEGMVLAIEVIYNMGAKDIFIDEADGWTIRTKDGKISGLFEKTAALVHGGFLVLT